MSNWDMERTVTVCALNRYVKALLESDENLQSIWVEGEITNCSLNSASGHLYFSLRDERAAVFAVMFRSSAARLRFLPKDGVKVQALCRVSLYEKGGSYQVVVEQMRLAGEGEQMRLLRQLQQKLASEGLFDQSRKRPLPAYPSSIAVVTSRDAAAFQDIIKILSRRWPCARVLLFHSSVQGIFAEEELVQAIAAAGASGCDVAVVSRGGGSKEDLFVFNSERVVRAAAALPMPFVSAVGHETDVTLIDLAADMRAPTPSAAAELISPDREAVLAWLAERLEGMAGSAVAGLDFLAGRALQQEEKLCSGMELTLQRSKDRRDGAAAALAGGISGRLDGLFASLAKLAAVSDSLSPLAVLGRGYCRVSRGGDSITSSRSLAAGDLVTLSFADGESQAVIQGDNR